MAEKYCNHCKEIFKKNTIYCPVCGSSLMKIENSSFLKSLEKEKSKKNPLMLLLLAGAAPSQFPSGMNL